MSKFTKEQLAEYAKGCIEYAEKFQDVEIAQQEKALFEIALAALTAEPVGAFHIFEQQVDGTTDYVKDGEWPVDYGVIEVYHLPLLEGLK